MPVFLFIVACASGSANHAGSETVSTGGDDACVQSRSTQKAPKAYYNKANPLQATESNLRSGWALFHKTATPLTCKTCHGATGNGLGDPDFESTPPARNFTCKPMMNTLPDGQLFWIIQNGSKNTSMPAFSDLKDEEIWQLVLYVRSLSQ